MLVRYIFVSKIPFQFFLPVTHVLSTLSSAQPKSVSTNKVVKKWKNTKNHDNEILLEDSLENVSYCKIICNIVFICWSHDWWTFNLIWCQVIRNFPDLNIDISTLNLKSFALYPFINEITMTNRIERIWRQSYVSSQTFFENKHGFPSSCLLSSHLTGKHFFSSLLRVKVLIYINMLCYCINFEFIGYCQLRGFKTVRGKEVHGLNSQALHPETSSSVVEKFITFRSWREPKDKTKLMNEAEQNEKLRSLLNDDTLPASEQQKLKVHLNWGYCIT